MNAALLIMLIMWAFVIIWIPMIIATNKKTHPKALFVLFFAEMWERFSFYGMRALLTLYMAKVLFNHLGSEANVKALGIYGAYTAMVYLFPVIGGMVADKIFGFRKAILFGGILMMIGHFMLAVQGMGFESNTQLFFLSLAFIIIGNGYFKPNISSFLGKFYEMNDPRKDGAFTIFYMGVNVGSVLATATCGYVGETISWHYGFGLAGIGMSLGLIVFWLNFKVFGDQGMVPEAEQSRPVYWAGLSKTSLVFIASIIMIPICSYFLNLPDIMRAVLLIASLLIIGFIVITAILNPDKVEGQRLLVVTVLFFFHAIFWALFEQAGGSLTLFADTNVDRMVMGSEIPASQFQLLNPLFVVLLAPLFSWFWIKLNKSNKEPSTPMKFVLGLTQLALGFLVIVLAGKYFANSAGMVSIIFVVVMYLLHTMGELSLSPVGLSMITKLSPGKIVGFTMGAWFLSISVGNSIAAWIGQLTSHEEGAEFTSNLESLSYYTDTYLTWGVYVVLGAAGVLLLLVPTLRKWMHGIH